MAIVLDGDGSISGLTTGSGIPADALSGRVPDSNAPSGSILQVVQTYKTDASSYQGIDVYHTVMQASITPSSASSKILVMASVSYGYESGAAQFEWYFFYNRNINGAGEVSVGNASPAGNRQLGIFQPLGTTTHQSTMALGTLANQYLDSPNTTLPTVYSLKMRSHNNLFYVNRSFTDTDQVGYSKRLTSSLTLMEIAG